jgi:hypothetical protein
VDDQDSILIGSIVIPVATTTAAQPLVRQTLSLGVVIPNKIYTWTVTPRAGVGGRPVTKTGKRASNCAAVAANSTAVLASNCATVAATAVLSALWVSVVADSNAWSAYHTSPCAFKGAEQQLVLQQ